MTVILNGVTVTVPPGGLVILADEETKKEGAVDFVLYKRRLIAPFADMTVIHTTFGKAVAGGSFDEMVRWADQNPLDKPEPEAKAA